MPDPLETPPGRLLKVADILLRDMDKAAGVTSLNPETAMRLGVGLREMVDASNFLIRLGMIEKFQSKVMED